MPSSVLQHFSSDDEFLIDAIDTVAHESAFPGMVLLRTPLGLKRADQLSVGDKVLAITPQGSIAFTVCLCFDALQFSTTIFFEKHLYMVF